MKAFALLGVLAMVPGALVAQEALDSATLQTAPSQSGVVVGGGVCPGTAVTIYDTTRTANQGAEITAAANGPAVCMGDLIVLDAVATERSVCEVSVDVFTLADLTPFDMTMEFYTACTTNGAGGSACGTGPGTLIPGSTATVTGVTPGALGTIFTVVFPYPAGVDLSGEADSSISVKINASRADVFWRINETPTVGTIPVGEPATSFVERCGSSAANNGCSRNFGVNNNFAMTIRATAGASADLSITKTDSADPVTVGGALAYTLDVNNAGPDTATNVSVVDTLPAGVGFVSASGAGWTCGEAAGVVTCTMPSLAVGPAAPITVNVTAPGSAGFITNVVTVSATESDPNGANNADSEDTVVSAAASADLSITKIDSIDPVTVSGALAYTLTVSNAGPDTATNVSVVDTLPAGVAFLSATGTSWTCGEAAGVVTCTLPSLAAGPAAPITVNVTAPAAAGSITNSTTVSATEIDPNGANNSDSEDTGVIAPANISATKSVAGSFLPGGPIIYTIVITNSGLGATGDNPGDEFTDVLPAGLTLVGASATSGTAVATIGTNTVTWNGSLAPSGSVTITIDATISAAAPAGSTISNQGAAFFDADGNGTNESTVSTDDPAAAGGADPTSFVVALGVQTPVPLFGLGGVLLLGGGLLMLALVVLRRRTA